MRTPGRSRGRTGSKGRDCRLARRLPLPRPRAPKQRPAASPWRPIAEAIDDLVDRLRFHRQVERLQSLGPRAIGELLAEIGEQRRCRTFIEMRLRAYAALDPEVVRELDGDQFPRPPLYPVKS